MDKNDKIIEELRARLDNLTRQQKKFSDEIFSLHEALQRLESPQGKSREAEGAAVIEVPARQTIEAEVPRDTRPVASTTPAPPVTFPVHRARSAWEDFIGTNLLNKIGIGVLVLGVAFGAKYSIDNQLINPLTRIILGYVAGVVLTGIALRLRKSHPAFSAVLLSGGMAVFYFITYAAHSFYDLIPQPAAFLLMVVFTAFTVFAALSYNLEVVSIIGLAGAYAVPFLLSDGSGRVVILFSYIAIINAGILVLAFKKYWRRLHYISFILTWLTFLSWFSFSFYRDHQTAISLLFSSIFFVMFYVTFLAYKIVKREVLNKSDIVLMLMNSFIYYGLGYLAISDLEAGDQYLGLFTVGNALVHFIACLVIYKTLDNKSDIFYFVAGMVLVFLTIAVPVQLEGNWVTLVWAGEAALMFWIGRSKSLSAYEKLSYPLMVLAFLSLLHDWSEHYPDSYFYSYQSIHDFQIFLNIQFLTSVLVGVSYLVILWVNSRYAAAGLLKPTSRFQTLITTGLPILTLFVFYVAFYKEIEAYWYNRYAVSRIPLQSSDGVGYDRFNHYLLAFKNIWLIIFSALFATVVSLVARKVWRGRTEAAVSAALNSVVLLFFITAGLLALSELRSGYFDDASAEYYDAGLGYVLIRYIAIAAMLPLLWLNRKLLQGDDFFVDLRKGAELYFHVVVLAVLSSELIHWLDMAQTENSFRLSLSILWGTYALMLVVYGLSRDAKHIRVAAIVLFAVTLLKLFAYDMAGMSTILKTVVMISLGALLLTASFIYNRFKRSAENEAP